VIFSDISQDWLDHCRKAAEAEGVLERCRFLHAPADQLSAAAAGSVDVVTTRSVLIYVKDKAGAPREFHRVLEPGGRISLFEPINVLTSEDDPGPSDGYDMRLVMALAGKVGALYESIHEFHHAVLAGCCDVPRIPGPKGSTAKHPGRDLPEFCRDRQGDVLRFCHGTRVWPTSNISERGVWPIKTRQKISGRLASEPVTQARLDIRAPGFRRSPFTA
jgi:SAM-dependent methyltransferase